MIRFVLAVSLLITSSCLGLRVTDSVVGSMETLESGEGLVPEKYSTHQYQEIHRALSDQRGRLRVMSYNMLFNIREEQLDTQHHWNRRLARIVALIEHVKPDIIGSQELHEDQLEDLLHEIGDVYAFFGRGTTDGRSAGEINGIFYRKGRFKPLLNRVWWMSANPDQPGPDGFSARAKTLTMVQLFDRSTCRRLAVFNTHLSFCSPNSRDQAARFIAHLTAPYAAEIPVIVTGDFNLFPNRPNLTELPFFDGHWCHCLLTSELLKDAVDVSVLGHIGPIATYTNVGTEPTPFIGTGEPGVILDHIYVSPQVCVLLHATEPAKVDGQFPSDHMPVLADVVIWR